MPSTLTVRQVCDAASVTRSQLDQWLIREYLELSDSPGRGKARQFNFGDTMKIAVLAALFRLGLTPKMASQFARHLYGFKRGAAVLVIWQGPGRLIQSSERGSPPPESDGPKIYDYVDSDRFFHSEIVRPEKLIDFINDEDKYGFIALNLDHVETNILTALGMTRDQIA